MRTIGLVNVDKTEYIIIENIPVQDGTLTYIPDTPQTPNWLYYSSEELTLTITAQISAGEYEAVFKPKEKYRWSDNTDQQISVKWTIDPIKISAIPSQSGTIPFDGKKHIPTWLNYDPHKLEVSGDIEAITPGTYRVLFKPKDSYIWDPEISVVEKGYIAAFWKIDKIIISKPYIETDTFAYNEQYHTVTIKLENPNDWQYIKQEGTTRARDKGAYTITWTLLHPDCAVWDTSETSFSEIWVIGLTIVAIPMASVTSFLYAPGVVHSLDIKKEVYDSSGNIMFVIRHGISSIENAGTDYCVWYELKDPESSVWEDGTKTHKYINWQIRPAQLIRPSWKTGAVTNFTYVKGTTRTIVRSRDIQGYDPGLMIELGEFSAEKKGIYTIVYSLQNNPNYCWDTGNPYEDTRLAWYIGVANIHKPSLTVNSFEYNGAQRKLDDYLRNIPSTDLCSVAGTKAETNVGNYQISYSLKDPDSYCWSEDGSTAPVTLPWSITPKKLPKVKPVQLSYSMQTGGVELQVTGYQQVYMNRTGYLAYTAGTFTAVYSLKNSNLTWDDGSTEPITIEWKVVGAAVEKKEFYQDGQLIYTGDPLQVQITNFNSSVMTKSGELERTKVGTYTCYVGLKSGYVWDDGTEDPVPVQWHIEQRILPIPAANPAVNPYTGAEITVKLTNYQPRYWTEVGMKEVEIGDYIATLTLKDTTQTVWAPSDPYNKVLLHFNNSSNPGYDECGNSWTYSNVTVNSSLNKFNSAAQVNGNSKMIIDKPIPLGGQDFTIDFWFYMKSETSYENTKQGFLYSFTAIDDSIRVYCHRTANGANTGNISCGFVIAGEPEGEGKSYSRIYQDCRNAWHHIAYVYQHSNTTVYCFYDGTQAFATKKSIARRDMNFELFNNSAGGHGFVGGYGLVGAIDEFRVSDGIARWTQNFNGQLPSAPYEYTWANPTAPAEIAWSIKMSNIPKPYAEKTEFDYDKDVNVYTLRLFNENFNYMERSGIVSVAIPDSGRATYTHNYSSGTISCSFPGTMNFTYNLLKVSTTNFNVPETKNYPIKFKKKEKVTYTNAPSTVTATITATENERMNSINVQLTVPGIYTLSSETEDGALVYLLSTDTSVSVTSYSPRGIQTKIVNTTTINLPSVLTLDLASRPGNYSVTYSLLPELGVAWADGSTDPVVINWKIDGQPLTQEQSTFVQEQKIVYDKKKSVPQTVSCAYDPKYHILVRGSIQGTKVGTYTAVFVPQPGYVWFEGGDEEITLTWKIEPVYLPTPYLKPTEYEYTGSDITILPTNITNDLIATGNTLAQRNVGSYVREYYVPDDEQYAFENSDTMVTITWRITPRRVPKPVVDTVFTYTGEIRRPTYEYDNIDYVSVTGVDSAVNAGYYTATYVVDTTTSVWIDGTKAPISIGWRIDRQELSEQNSNFIAGSFDANKNNNVTTNLAGYNATYHNISGQTTAYNVGIYTCYVTPKPNYCWYGSTNAQKLPDAVQAQKTVQWTVGAVDLDIVVYDRLNTRRKPLALAMGIAA